jgi:glucose-6-phosphate 1-dehydrogenase
MIATELDRHLPSAASTEALAPATLVVLGGTGDLARRKLLPALYNLARDGRLPRRFTLLGVARGPLGDGEYRRRVAEAITTHSRRPPDIGVLRDLLARVHYLPGHVADPRFHAVLGDHLTRIEAPGESPADRLFYLSIAPELFSPVVEGLGAVGLQRRPGAEVKALIEKPFGRSAQEARDFNRTLLSVFAERQVFRIDHYLGKEEVQNIIALRFANAVFEPLWNAASIAAVQLTAAEDLGVAGRAGFYEGAGALRDHVQNHMLQLLSMVCMEPPADLGAVALRDEKVKVLRAISPPKQDAVARGQYGAGMVAGVSVDGYREEEGVGAGSRTETYAALRLEVNTPRWAGVPIYLRTGKRLARKRTEIAIRLRPTRDPGFFHGTELDALQHQLVIGLQASGSVQLSFATKVPGRGMRVRPVTVELPAPAPEVAADPYERLLLDALAGDPTLFTRSDEIEQQWRICDPVIARWADSDEVPPMYTAGSQGPKAADAILRGGDAWRAL